MSEASGPAPADELLEVGDGLVELDRNWVIVRVNAAQERSTGRPRSETVGRVFWDVWPEAVRTSAWRECHRCMEDRVPVAFEDCFGPFDTCFGITAHPTSTGGIAVFFRDVTERKRAEQHVRAERDFSTAVLDTLASLVLVLDPEGRIVRFNAACERATGFGASEVLGKSVFELLIPGAELAGAQAVFRQLRMGDFPNQHRNRWRMKDGTERLLDWSNTALADEDGTVRFIIATGVDITDRERAVEALRQSERRLRAIFEDVAIGVVEVDEQDRFVAVNRRFCAMLGYARDELLGRSLHDLTAPEDHALTRALNAKGHSGELSEFQYEKRYLKRDGSRLWVQVNVSVVKDASGRFLRAVGTAQDIAARKRAEAALRASEAKFRSVFEQAAIGMGRVRFEDARWIDVNDAFCRMLGRSRQEMLATSWPDMTHPQDVDLDLVPFRSMAAGELDSYTIEKRFRHRDGHDVWARLTLSLVRDESGDPDYEIAIIEDVTERKRAEEAVRAAARAAEDERRRLATVLEALPAGVAITDAAGAFTHVNAEFRRIWGGPPSPRSAQDYGAWRGWWPDGRSVAAGDWALSRALGSGAVIVPGDVVDIEKFDGSGRATVVNAAAPIRDADGVIVGGVLTEVDISVQRRAEEAARAAEQRMRSVVEHLPSGLVVADLSTGDLHWNAEALRIHGYTGEGDEHRLVDSLVAEHDLRTLAGDPIPVDRWPLPRLLARESFREYELRVRNTRLGWDRVFSYSGVVVALDSGPAFGLLAIQDVSARSRAETALRVANERLLEADRRKDDFLGMLSHELRSPLAPVRNALYILDHAQPEGQQARRAKDIAGRQVAHLTRLVDDLLDVTRIARGKIELRHEELDLGGLVRRTAEDYRPLMQDRGLDLTLDVPPAPVLVTGDPARLTQVFGNLLNNAAKFTPAGGRVSLALRSGDGRAVVHVLDTGPGIAPELLPKVFEPFTQGKQTLARTEGGLGLGLSLVKGLVTLHGGEVAVSSHPGAGADFAVSLALASPTSEAVRSPRSPPAPSASPAARHRVLVVDDNHDAAESLGELVQMLGHEVELAYDGRSAVAQAARTRPDLVLCDIGLPGMDGYQVARELRARHDGELRLVALSGYAQPEDVERALEAGFDAHVAKPPDPEKLIHILGS